MEQKELELIERAMRRRIAAMPTRLRPFTTEYGKVPRTMILTGARGCGKSTFMLHHIGQKRILYMSMDNPLVATVSLYNLVSEIFMLGYEGVVLDEVHYATDWSMHLKALYDDFPGKYIWASDSSSLILRAGDADLSRRYVRIAMPLMSFREYLYLETGNEYPIYKLGDTKLPLEPDADILDHFRYYRHNGTRPFYLEGDYENRYLSLLNKVINADIPYFLPNITDNNLRLMRAVVGTLAKSSVPRIQVNSLCTDWAIGAQKLYQLLFVMESVELISVVRYPTDNKANSVGAKLLFSDPCAYHVMSGDLGTEREAYVVNCFRCAGYQVYAAKDERKGDYIITKGTTADNHIFIEVGGKNKTPKQSDYVVRDNTDYPVRNALPAWLLAMMW